MWVQTVFLLCDSAIYFFLFPSTVNDPFIHPCGLNSRETTSIFSSFARYAGSIPPMQSSRLSADLVLFSTSVLFGLYLKFLKTFCKHYGMFREQYAIVLGMQEFLYFHQKWYFLKGFRRNCIKRIVLWSFQIYNLRFCIWNYYCQPLYNLCLSLLIHDLSFFLDIHTSALKLP